MFPVLALAALSAWTGAAQPRTSAIPPISGKKAYRLPLPPYQTFCWFSADRGRWPGDGNRVLPWFGRTSPGNLLDSRPNPSTAKPGDHAMFALFHLKDGNFMAVLPVAAPDSLAWLKLERDGTFLVEAGSATVIIGPGSLDQAHTVDEFVEKAQLLRAAKLYREIAMDVLK